MKFFDTKSGMVLTIGAVGAIAIYFLKKDINNAAAAAGQSINPVNPNNIFASGVNNVGEVLTGNENFNLGSWIYDITH